MFKFTRQDAADLLNELGLTDKLGNRLRADSGETATFLRSLTYILTRTFDRKYPELKARRFIPVNNEVGNGAESFVWRSFDIAGMAKVITNFADDLPLVDVIAGEVAQKIKSVGDAYIYSVQDLRASAMAGTQLDVKRAMAVRRMIENLIEVIAANGDSKNGLPGFTNNANVPVLSAPGDITGGWETASSAEILDDLNAMANTMVINTKEIFKPDTMILPTSRYSLIATKPYSNIDPTPVLTVFLRNNPYIRQVDQWAFLNTADAAGTGPRAIVYARAPENLELYIPQEFEQFPPQAKNLSFLINCHARIGGVVIYYPLAVEYVDGI